MTATALINLEAELDVLGAAIFDPTMLDSIADLKPAHFYEPLHARIFEAIRERVAANEAPEPSTLASLFSTDPSFLPEHPGGPAPNIHLFFLSLVERAPPTAWAITAASTIIDAAQRRMLVELAGGVRDGANDPTVAAYSTLTATSGAITSMMHASAPASITMVSALEAARGTVVRLNHEKDTGKKNGRLTGLRCFDQRLHGIRPAKLIVVAGRPSMGKTSLARAAAIGCARRNPDEIVAYYCVEMDREEMSERTLAQITRERGHGIPYFDMQGDELSHSQLDRLAAAAEEVPPNFILDDSSTLSLDHVVRRSHSLAKKGKLAAIFIDYIQIMEMPRGFNNSRNEAIGEITSTLKRLAKDLGCGIVALSQLSRDVEKREDKRPQLSDLRDSGSIEQDADVVMFPYRESYYLERQGCPKDTDPLVYEARIETMKNKMEVMTAKFRGGAIGNDMQRYSPAFDIVINEGEQIMPWEPVS
jgi:replicative DNA helicase